MLFNFTYMYEPCSGKMGLNASPWSMTLGKPSSSHGSTKSILSNNQKNHWVELSFDMQKKIIKVSEKFRLLSAGAVAPADRGRNFSLTAPADMSRYFSQLHQAPFSQSKANIDNISSMNWVFCALYKPNISRHNPLKLKDIGFTIDLPCSIYYCSCVIKSVCWILRKYGLWTYRILTNSKTFGLRSA